MAMIIAQRLKRIAAELQEIADALAAEDCPPVRLGSGRYNRSTGAVRCGKKDTILTKSQATILNALLDSGGVTLSRSELMVHIHGPNAATLDSRSVDNHICVLRHLLGTETITTVNGRGYRL